MDPKKDTIHLDISSTSSEDSDVEVPKKDVKDTVSVSSTSSYTSYSDDAHRHRKCRA